MIKNKGLTLIEVLIALAIVSIAMTAIIKATAQNVRSTTYLQNKMIALWVGEQVLSEARVGIVALPKAPDKLNEKTWMLGREYYWQAAKDDTPNQRIKKISVKIFTHEVNDDDETPVLKLESYVYAKE